MTKTLKKGGRKGKKCNKMRNLREKSKKNNLVLGHLEGNKTRVEQNFKTPSLFPF